VRASVLGERSLDGDGTRQRRFGRVKPHEEPIASGNDLFATISHEEPA